MLDPVALPEHLLPEPYQDRGVALLRGFPLHPAQARLALGGMLFVEVRKTGKSVLLQSPVEGIDGHPEDLGAFAGGALHLRHGPQLAHLPLPEGQARASALVPFLLEAAGAFALVVGHFSNSIHRTNAACRH